MAERAQGLSVPRDGATLRDARPADFPEILALNRTWVAVLSPLDAARLEALHAQAALHRVVEDAGRVAAFLLAFRERSAYDGANYRWFAARHARFLYVDRVVVAGRAQGRGYGRWLYADAIAQAGRDAVPAITCEYDVDPPNLASRRFHAAFGFREEGRRELAGGKVVSMQVLDLAAVAASSADAAGEDRNGAR